MPKLVNWQYCRNPNEINDAILTKNENWSGITAENIISIAWNSNHGCYEVFWTSDDASTDRR